MSETQDADARVEVDVAVIGGGLMGAATCWQLARRGRRVALFEAFDLGHRRGSSHGSSRIFRLAYPDPFYVRLADRAAESWRELEADTGATLLRTTGGLDAGTTRDPAVLAAAMAAAGVPHELLPAAAVRERWPQFHFGGGGSGSDFNGGSGDGTVLFHPQAGILDADATIAACTRRAAELGARILTGVRVVGAEPLSGGGRGGGGSGRRGGGVRVRAVRTYGAVEPNVEPEVEVTADTLVVAAGAWLPELAGHLGAPLALPPLTVLQQEVFHFRQRDPDACWPTFVDKGGIQIFGLPSGADGGPGPAVKVARYDGGLVTTASTRSGVVDPVVRAAVTDYVRRRLPGLDPVPIAEASCLFTMAPGEDFVLDRCGPVVVVSPCSGHGAKFAPLIGALAADLAVGAAAPHPRFALAAA